MSWNGSGTYVLTATYYPEVNGTVIDAVRYNGLMADLATGINNALAKDGQNAATANIPMGGFKFTGLAAGSAAGNSVRMEQAFIQSTSTVTLAASTSNIETPLSGNILLDGTGITVTAFAAASAAGILRLVRFNGVNTLTHASTFSLPGSANITTASGDCGWVESTASGWAFRDYIRNNGTSLYQTVSDGTVSAPGWAFTSDSDLGFYRIGANSLGLTAGNQLIATFSQALIALATNGSGSDITLTGGTTAGSLITLTANGITLTSVQDGSGDVAGTVTISGGAAVGGGGAGGAVTISGGDGSSSAIGGAVTIRSGKDSGSINGADILFQTGSTGDNEICKFDGDTGHLQFTNDRAGAAPTITSGAGTGASIVGSDQCFRVTLGTTPTTSVVITFAKTWTNAPMCFANHGNASIAVRCTATTSTVTITFASTPTAGHTLEVLCVGYY